MRPNGDQNLADLCTGVVCGWSKQASVSKEKSANESSARECSCREHSVEARLIQSSLLPTRGLCHDSLEIAYRFLPFSEVGGDFLDFFSLPDGFIGIYLGDVVGKGLPAAMYAALVSGTLRGIHKSGTDTASVLTRLNDRLWQRPLPGRFSSILYALFNPATRELVFSNAAMPLPLLVSGASCEPLGEGGFPVGMFPSVTYIRNVALLHPGDSVLFATDGLHELLNPNGDEFCAAQMEKVWAQCGHKSASESADFVFARQSAFSDGTPPHDDIAALVLRVL